MCLSCSLNFFRDRKKDLTVLRPSNKLGILIKKSVYEVWNIFLNSYRDNNGLT